MTFSFSGFLNTHKEIFSVPHYSAHFAFQDALASRPYPPQQWLTDQAYHKTATADPQRAKFCSTQKGPVACTHFLQLAQGHDSSLDATDTNSFLAVHKQVWKFRAI